MTMEFAPRRPRGRLEADMRVRLILTGKTAKPTCRAYGVDFSVAPSVTESWSVRSGDRVVCTVEEDGTWLVTRCEPGRPGYHVRSRAKTREAILQFRVNVTPDQARRIFGDETRLTYDFVTVDNGGSRAMFAPKRGGMTFVPARGR